MAEPKSADKAQIENTRVNSANTPPSPTSTTEDGSTSGNFLSSYIARTSGDQTNAIRYLEQLYTDDPNNPTIQNQLLIMKLLSGDITYALKLAAQLQNVDSHELIVDLLLSIEQVRLGQFKGASDQLTKIHGAANDTLWIPLIQTWLDAGQGKLKQPVEAIDFVTDTSKIPSFLYYHLALINDFANFTEAAERQYELATADIARSPYRAIQARSSFYLRHNRLDESSALLSQYAEARTEGWKLIEKQASIPVASIASSVQEGVSEVLFSMASILYSADQGYDTQLYLQMSVYLRPDFPPAWLMLGTTFEANGNFADASHAYGMVSQNSPLYQKALLRKAFILDKQGDPDQAIAMLDKLGTQQVDSKDPFIAKGDLLRSKSKFKEAADAYSQAIALIKTPDTTDWALYFARGACMERSGDLKAAEADFLKSLELNPEQPEVLNYLGYMWLVQDNKVADAAAMITRAYEQRPDEPHIIDSMAWVYYRTGKLQEASDMLERALSLMPADASINEHLGDVYWQQGKKTQARYSWNKALQFVSDPQTKTSIQEKLEKGLPKYSVINIPNVTAPELTPDAN